MAEKQETFEIDTGDESDPMSIISDDEDGIEGALQCDDCPQFEEFQQETPNEMEQNHLDDQNWTEAEWKQLETFAVQLLEKLEALRDKTQASLEATTDLKNELSMKVKELDLEVELMEKQIVELNQEIKNVEMTLTSTSSTRVHNRGSSSEDL